MSTKQWNWRWFYMWYAVVGILDWFWLIFFGDWFITNVMLLHSMILDMNMAVSVFRNIVKRLINQQVTNAMHNFRRFGFYTVCIYSRFGRHQVIHRYAYCAQGSKIIFFCIVYIYSVFIRYQYVKIKRSRMVIMCFF